MKKLAIICLFLSASGFLVAIINVCVGAPRRPDALPDLFGYAVGACLIPLILLISGLYLLKRAKAHATPAPRKRDYLLFAFNILLGVLYLVSSVSTYLSQAAITRLSSDIDRPKELMGEGFSLQYPGNWNARMTHVENTGERLYEITTPLKSCVNLKVFPPTPGTTLSLDVDGAIALLSQRATIEDKQLLDTWGRHDVEGVGVVGTIDGIRTLIVYAALNDNGRSALVTELRFLDEGPIHETGFKLIADTFRWSKAPIKQDEDRVEPSPTEPNAVD